MATDFLSAPWGRGQETSPRMGHLPNRVPDMKKSPAHMQWAGRGTMGEGAPRSRAPLTPGHLLLLSCLQKRQPRRCWLAQVGVKRRQRKPQSKVMLLRGMSDDGSWR